MSTGESDWQNVEASAKKHVILLVEDEPVVREVTTQVLESAGYRVLAAGSPSQALELAREHQWDVDLLLTDVVMPEMNGIDLAEKLRQLQPKLVTVFVSGYAEGDLLRSIHARSAIHIQKPFTLHFLLSRVSEALEAAKVDGAPVR